MPQIEPVVQLARPTSIVQRPTTTDAYVTSVGGALVRVPLTGGTGTVVANVADLISTRGESGLLDLAFDATGNLLYLSLVERNRDLVVWEVPIVGWEPDLFRWREVRLVPGRVNGRARRGQAEIGGFEGTSEIQRLVIARAISGLRVE